MAKRIGPRMNDVLSFVISHPGKVMFHAARYVGPRGSLRYGYATVHRAIDAGLVVTKPGSRGATLLFPIES